MRKPLPPEIERWRIKVDGYPLMAGTGQGWFKLIHPETGAGLMCLVCDGTDWEKGLPLPKWEHVSVRKVVGTPLWREMAFVKAAFWMPEECVVEFHPPQADYVNIKDNCLHLWKPIGIDFPMPPKECV